MREYQRHYKHPLGHDKLILPPFIFTAPTITIPPHISPCLHTSLFHKHISIWFFLSFIVQESIKVLRTKDWYNVIQRKQKRSDKLDLLEKDVSILWSCHPSCLLTMLVDTKLVTILETKHCHLVNLHKYNYQNFPFYTNLLIIIGIDYTLGHCGLSISCNKQVLNEYPWKTPLHNSMA